MQPKTKSTVYTIEINKNRTLNGSKGKMRLPTREQNHAIIIGWYDEYGVAIFKYILKLIRDEQQAEDLTQDTFLRVYSYIEKNKQIDYPKTFLYQVAHHITIDYIRKQKPLQLMKDFFSFQKDPGPSVESIVEIRESSQELYDALAKLKSSYRRVIILRKIEEFSTRETGDILGWSESKVKSTLSRGMKALKKHLTKEGVNHEI